VAYNFQTGNTKIKLLTEYKIIAQKVLVFIESILEIAKQLQNVCLYFVVSGLKITGHGNSDNNLELLCISIYLSVLHSLANDSAVK
jgi:hypothetical protein